MRGSETGPLTETLAARCDGVGKTYVGGTGKVSALVDVEAGFPAGRVTAVAGPSGSGKSTLLRLIACLDRPDSGLVEVAGVDVARLRVRARRAVRRRTVGYLFQDPAANLLGYLTAAENIRLAARLRGRVGGGEPARLLELVGLRHRADHVPRRLSGGEQQRLAVAATLAGGPAVLVADEPTAQLDRRSGEAVLRALHEAAAYGVGVIVASHDADLTAAADRVLTLADGTLGRST